MILREPIVDHYRMGRQQLGLEFVRAHGIFHDEMGILRPAAGGVGGYAWRAVDAAYDRLLETGVRPFVELSFMPAALASGSQTCFHWQGNVTPPRDFREWGALVEAFARHLVERYGLDEVRQWRFEVWNEPNLRYFWAGTQEQYWALYDWAAEAIKRVDPELRVGGPATAAGAWVEAFVRHCREGHNACTGGRGAPMDFVSYHGYATDAGQVLDGETVPEQRYDTYWYEMARRNHRTVREIAGEAPEIHVTEWNSTSRLGDPRLDGANQAAFIGKTVHDVAGYVDSFSFWTLSDIFEEGGWPGAEFHGGFGLITVHGVTKPGFHAFAMLHRLGDRRLPVESRGLPEGAGALATRRAGAPGLQVLLWHHVSPEHDSRRDGELPPTSVTVEVRGLEAGGWTLQQWLVDRLHSNAHTAWQEMGSPARPDPGQLARLQERAGLDRVRLDRGLKVDGPDAPLVFHLALPPAAVTLVELHR